MPSSPGPNEYKRTLQRFFYRGICLMPQDALPEGKVAWALNIRSYEEGTIEVRYGLDPLLDAALANPIHSLFRMDDTTPFAGAGQARRFLGAGTDLRANTPGTGTTTLVESGFSGDPLSAVVADSFRAPRPFIYVADSNKLRKVDSALTDYSWGISTPLTAPEAQLAAPQTTYLDSIGGAATWVGYGGGAFPGGLLVPLNRINTSITQILYDEGTTGMASVVPLSFDNITPGATIDVAAVSPETIIVQSIHPPVASTTVDAILYDSGNTGMCSIQPTAGFSVGQIEAPIPEEIERRYRDLNLPVPPRVTVTRTVDFPVDSIILLDGVEYVRIQSIAIGPDGVMSFRCYTNGTFAAGATIAGIASFRAYFLANRSIGDTLTALAVQINITPVTTTDPEVVGFQEPVSGPGRNWAQVGNRATSPDDRIRFGIKCNLLGYVQFIRLVLDLSPVGPAFLRDYYVYEWRAADLLAAIQAESELTTGTFADAQSTAVERGQVTQLYSDQYGQGTVETDDGVLTISPDGKALRRPSPNAEYTGRRAIPRDAPVAAGSSVSRQLALGNDAWMTLECRVGDLTRVGTQTDLNLSNVLNACVYAQVLADTVASPPPTITLDLSDIYLVGGYGPDVSQTLPPYVYRYSYRSSITGERSNTSPPMRAGVRPQRNRVTLTIPTSSAAQCDSIDIWRFGGALARWTYVGTQDNDPAASPAETTFNDDMADGQIDGGPAPPVDQFQPWPTTDLPRSGTCNVAGTSIEWVSGDQFNTEWAADSGIIINGRATQLYRQPSSTTRLEVVHNCGAGLVEFQLPSPTLVAQPLPVVWGGQIQNVFFTFACGDPQDPGTLHWSNANDPDASSDKNTIAVTSSGEPLQNGFMDDGIPYVFSTERLYRIVPTFGDISPFRVVETSCTKGLWARWAMAVDPDGGCYFVAKDGIYRTAGGGDAQPISAPDLQPLFPHDGAEPEAIRNLNPIDFTQTTRLRLSFVDGILYFDYVDTAGEGHTLLYEPRYSRWTPDAYYEDQTVSPSTTIGAVVRISEPGPQVHNHLIATEDGQLQQYTLDKTTDNLEDINWAIWTTWAHGEDPRSWKQWGDAVLDFNPGGSVNGVLVTPVVDNGNVALGQRTLGAGDSLRDTYLVEVGATGQDPGYGVISRNFGLWIEGAVQACDIQRPIFYLWEPAFLWKGMTVARRATDWEDLGYKGAKFIQGVVIRANTFGVDKSVAVQYDGPNLTPQTALTLTLNHDGEQTKAYPLAAAGWTPFLAELVRLQGTDDDDWVLLDWRFVWEPAPELATQWETQDTTFDLPGFLSVHDAVMAYAAPAPVSLTVWHDQAAVSYTLPATTGGDYQRVYSLFEAKKGKSVRFRLTADQPFRLFKRDCSVRIQGWGVPGGYQTVNPFGGPHRVDGAEI